MNSFSSLVGLGRGGTKTNTNSFNYINRSALNITTDYSGTSFTDLSNTSLYAITAGGLNMTNGNSTFCRLKINGNAYLKPSDLGTGSFDIYMKHAARYSDLSPFGFQYPNMIEVDRRSAQSGYSFVVSFYSSLNPGSIVPYSITGCSSAELSSAVLTGTYTAPYHSIQYNFIKTGYIAFPSSTLSSTVLSITTYPVVYYDVTVVGGKYYFNGTANPPNPVFTTGNVYIFRQTAANNAGNTLVFGATVDSPSYFSGMSVNAVAGNPLAYTMMNFSVVAVPSPLYYYSQATPGMVYIPPPVAPTAPKYFFEFSADSTPTSMKNTITGLSLATYNNSGLDANQLVANGCFRLANTPTTIAYADIYNSIVLSTSFTISFWINVKSVNATFLVVDLANYNKPTFPGVQIPGFLQISISSTLNISVMSSSATSNLPSFNTWHHLVFSFSRSGNTYSCNGYANGTNILTCSFDVDSRIIGTDTVTDYTIGRASVGPLNSTFYFLDNYRHFDYALSAANAAYYTANDGVRPTVV